MIYFMKVYPKQGPDCLVICASARAVNLKTHQKWVWAYVKAIAVLVNVVASLLYFFAFVYWFIIDGNSIQSPPLPADTIAIHWMLSPYAIVIRRRHLTSPPPHPPTADPF